jgi:RNA polymerase sigma-70 factor, ECF subfamily
MLDSLDLDFSDNEFSARLQSAKEGGNLAQGHLIAACRHYLLSVANQELARDIKAKVAPSDLVQDSCLEGQQNFAQFDGQTREELLAWLRGILLFNIGNAERCFRRTAKRTITREISLDDRNRIGGAFEIRWDGPSPSDVAVDHETSRLVEAALQKLPVHFQTAIVLRHQQHCSFAEIGKQLNRSTEAARKLWARGIDQLRRELKAVRKQP